MRGQMKMTGRAVPLVLAGVAALAVGLAASLLWHRPPAPPELSQHTTWLDPPKALAPFELVDHRESPFGLDELRGHWSFLFFGYTHCPDVCPTTLGQLNAVAERLGGDQNGSPRFVFVSVDPDRDTPQRIADFVGYFNPAFVGVTGDPKALEALTRQLGVLSLKVQRDEQGGGYLVDHTAAIFLIDPRGRLQALFSPPLDTEAMIADFRALARYLEAAS